MFAIIVAGHRSQAYGAVRAGKRDRTVWPRTFASEFSRYIRGEGNGSATFALLLLVGSRSRFIFFAKEKTFDFVIPYSIP